MLALDLPAPLQDVLNTTLDPVLRQCRVPDELRSRVCADISRRLLAVLAYWRSPTTRGALLLPTTDAAWWHEPQNVPLDVRRLVVLAIRNSLLEELHAETPARAAFRAAPRLTTAHLTLLTSSASAALARLDLDALGTTIAPSADRLFQPLMRRYPRTWAVFHALGDLARTETGVPVVRGHRPTVPPLRVLRGWWRARRGHGTDVFASAFQPQIEPTLAGLVALLRRGALPVLFVPSLFSLSRDPTVLSHVRELVLTSPGALVTPNWYVSAWHVARRPVWLRPPRTEAEIDAALRNVTGLTPKHRAALEYVRANL